VAVVAVDDRIALERFFRQRPGVHAYELGDLDDFFWPNTTWFGWHASGRIGQVALLYDEPDPPVLLALAEEPDDEMRALLQSIARELPERVYAHLSPGFADALAPSLVPTGTPVRHLKLHLVEPQRLVAFASDEAVALSASDLAEVAAFYECAYPDTWFQARMLETGRYVGIRRDGELVCVAGVHVWSPRWRVACLGNVATLPVARGTGLATTACARLCRVLLEDGIDVVSLNVRADNVAAIRTYEKLGFAHAADYLEVMLGAGASRAARS
jgi:ribosomal protein S18 acetylase RimI-like enzyme